MMENEKRLIDANAFQFVPDPVDNIMNGVLFMGRSTGKTLQMVKYCLEAMIENAPTVDAIPVAEIKAYLQARLDEWNALGDRKWEPANMWAYNFIMACFDDLAKREDDEHKN